MNTRMLLCVLALSLASCHRPGPTVPEDQPALPAFEAAESPAQLLIAALDELQFITDWEPGTLSRMPKPGTDTTFIYGEVRPAGYGAVVTERHSYPKGLLLISVRRTYGREGGRIVSEASSYISFESFLRNDPQSSVVTELYALSSDTIVTHISRNGQIETYTFRLPVITTVLGESPGLTRVTLRYGRTGRIVVESRDGNGVLLQERTSWGESDGSLYAQTTGPDGSWRRTRTLGTATGSILRETLSGTGAP